MLERKISIEIRELLSFFPVLGIIGPRQVGKTTLAKTIIGLVDKDVQYIDLESPTDIAKLREPELFFEANIDRCIILDEVQRMPELFPILRSVIDKDRKPARFVILGSASPELIRDSSESLAGRIAYKELFPFNFLEVKGVKQLTEHWLNGGFPNALLQKQNISKLWRRNFIQTYLERDLPMLGLSASPDIIRRLWYMLAHMHGNILNYETLSRSLGLTAPSVKKYISFLEEAFLVFRLKPFYQNMKKRLIKSPKIYVRDSGILHSLLQIDTEEQLLGHTSLGASWEGYVIEQITEQVKDDYDLAFYRTHQGAECDLVLLKSGKPEVSIEIKYTSTPRLTKGFVTSIDDLQTKKNFFVTPFSDTFPLRKDITVFGLENFLEMQEKGF